jgi:hypothetical protein
MADRGLACSFREAYRAASKKYGRYLWLIVLQGLIVAGPIVGVLLLLGTVALVTAELGGSSMQGAMIAVIPLIVLVYIGGMVYAVFMMIRLAVVFPACVEEDLPAMAAVKRSLQLTRNAKGRIFVVMLVVYAANYAAMMIFEVIFAILAALFAFPLIALHANQVVLVLALVVIGPVFLAAFLLVTAGSWATYATGFVVLYRDQRLRIDPKPLSGPIGAPEPEAAL